MELFPNDSPQPYRVLARKYRPEVFDDLLGQDAVVRTLANAIRSNRLAQAWLLTGVRGVGKTSTARIIAKALNCIGPDGTGGPTIAPCGVCEHCQAIARGQHIDVIEMDAASNTGVDSIREIIEAVRYASVSARYKVYIIDEVHMLSKGAFNALLKTLEEPPPHVKFIFATTEVEKLPATILSRCQRFDLRRVPAGQLVGHFATICEKENVGAEEEALALVARMAEGSVRDGLSILDQAIALSGDEATITAATVRDMLGLADHGRSTALLKALAEGQPAEALDILDTAYEAGVEPQHSFEALLDLVHLVTRARISGKRTETLSEEEQATVAGLGGDIGFSALHRLWQLLLKALQEIRLAPVPRHAAEMAALRIAHAAHLPDPGQLLRELSRDGPAPTHGEKKASGSEDTSGQPAGRLDSPAALIRLFEERGEVMLAHRLRDKVGVAELAPGRLRLATDLGPAFGDEVARCLRQWTGEAWDVDIVPARRDIPSEYEREKAHLADLEQMGRNDPRVQELLRVFPDANVRVEPLKRSGTA